jgi:hypothetical protein
MLLINIYVRETNLNHTISQRDEQNVEDKIHKMRDKILTIDLDFGLGFMDLGLLIYIPAYLEEQRRRKVRKIYTCIYVETNRERERVK